MLSDLDHSVKSKTLNLRIKSENPHILRASEARMDCFCGKNGHHRTEPKKIFIRRKHNENKNLEPYAHNRNAAWRDADGSTS